MAQRAETAREARLARHLRIRKKVMGTPERPRVSVFRSLNHIYAQVIDDRRGQTLAHASSLDPEIRSQGSGTKRQVAARVGELLAKRATEAGIRQVVFDRGGYKYHGRVRALADAARKGGLLF